MKRDLNLKLSNLSLVSLLGLVSYVIGIYLWIVVLNLVLGWLVDWHVFSPTNHFIFLVRELLSYFTAPALGVVRQFLPPIKGIDLSPYVVILILWFLKAGIERLILRIIPIGKIIGQKKRK